MIAPGATAAMLASSLSWAAFDALRKRLARDLAAGPLLVWLSAGQVPLFLVWLGLTPEPRIDRGYLLPGGAALALNALASLWFLQAVRRSPLSRTVPLLSFTPVFSSLFSAVLLGEWLSPSQSAGVALVVAGALLLDASPRRRAERRRALLHEPGARLMLGVALLWSLTAVVDKAALRHAPVALHAALQCGGVAAVAALLLAARGRLGEVRAAARPRPALGLALLAAAGGLGLQLVAIQLTLVGIVEAVKRAVGMLSAVAVGRLAFAEPVTAGTLAGVLAMAGGVALLLT